MTRKYCFCVTGRFSSKIWLLTTSNQVWMLRYRCPVPMSVAVCDLWLHAGVKFECLEMVRAARSYLQYSGACRRKFSLYGSGGHVSECRSHLPYPLHSMMGYPSCDANYGTSEVIHDTLDVMELPDPEHSEFFAAPCSPMEQV